MIKIIVIFVLGAYLLVVAIAYFYADRLIFQPQPSSYQDSQNIIKLESSPGVVISALHLVHPEAEYTILYSHGNAEDIGIIYPILEELRGYGFSVFAYDYRGYGTSVGTPTEKNAYKDINAAYNYLTQNIKLPPEKIIALGRSLGGAITVDLASREPLGGIIIESSFVSAYRVLTSKPLFLFDKFNTHKKLKHVHIPALIVHGTKDEIIPLWHGEALFKKANPPKFSYWVPGAHHNDLFLVANEYKSHILRFARKVKDVNNKIH